MTASHGPDTSTPTDGDRVPLRLEMVHSPADGLVYDGTWRPQSDDLTVELPDLLDHLPRELGHVIRVVYTAAQWQPAPRRILLAHRWIKAGHFPRDERPLLLLTLTSHRILRLLVEPADAADGQALAAR
ncbi:DUF5994 family protein [Solicola sp. PLA-1-18]|uniref:DUF5994 family protein n=1 Tax=Solicola sp. PLA-1-18 TaxID=3380532 RepID=UPI003B805880